MVTLAVLPNCVQCVATKRHLDKRGIDYEVVDLGMDTMVMERVKTLGYSQAPVVFAGDEHWSGFDPERIDALVA